MGPRLSIAIVFNLMFNAPLAMALPPKSPHSSLIQQVQPRQVELPPRQPRLPLPTFGKKPKTEIQYRAQTGDRGLAELIAEKWTATEPTFSFAKRLETIVGEPLSFKQFDLLRKANLDLLGRITKQNGLVYTPRVRQRLAELIDANPDLSYAEIAKRYGNDDVLAEVGRAWTVDRINDVIKHYPDEFLRRSKTERTRLTPALWERVRTALLEFPVHEYDEIVEVLHRDPQFRERYPGVDANVIRRLIPKYSTTTAIGSERDAAFAEKLAARFRELPQNLTINELLQRVAHEFPHRMSPEEFRVLRRKYPETLGAWSGHRVFVRNGKRLENVTSDAESRMRAIALEHPTLNANAIVARLNTDPLTQKYRWTPTKLFQMGTFPSRRERDAALANHAAEIWERQAKDTPIEENIALIAREHPGFSLAMLAKLVQIDSRLASLVRRTRDQELTRDKGAIDQYMQLNDEGLLALRLSSQQLEKHIVPSTSTVVERWARKLERLESEQGNGDGLLTPRDVAGAEPLTRYVMTQIYRQIGRKTVSLIDIREALPKALAGGAVFNSRNHESHARELYLDAAREILGEWIEQFRRDVIEGSMTTEEFQRTQSLNQNTWAALRTHFPAQFSRPVKSAIDGVFEVARENEVQSSQSATVTSTATAIKNTHTFGRLSRETALEVSTRANEIFSRDVLATRADILAEINRDSEITARHGEFTVSRYNSLQARFPTLFPRIEDREAVLHVLANEIRGVLAQNPRITRRELILEMQRRHPRFRSSRLYQLREAFPGEVMDGQVGVRANRSQSPKTRSLETPAFVTGTIEPKTGTFRRRVIQDGVAHTRTSFTIHKLFQLTLALLPPGAGHAEIINVVDNILVERGLPPYRSTRVPLELPIEEHGASMAAEVVAEYARTATRGETDADILARVQRDYPLLTNFRLTRFQTLWSKHPERYEALKPFIVEKRDRIKQLHITGLGERVSKPRFLGGWNVDRAVLNSKNKEMFSTLAHQSQFLRIPDRLPLLDKLVDNLQGKRPLEHKNVLWVSHLLASTYPLGRALNIAGLSTSRAVIVGTPYGSNPAVVEALKHDGFDVRVPALSTVAYRNAVEQAIDQMVALHRANGHPIVVMDDGGLVVDILHSHPEKYDKVMSAFRIVEQTTRGITVAEGHNVGVPVIAAARALSKQHEATFIGAAVARKVMQGLRRLDSDLVGKEVVILGGGGWVGQNVAEQMRNAGARVTVVEPSRVRRSFMRKKGYRVADKERALSQADIVIGTSGERSMGLEDLRLLKTNAIIASASSKQVEFDMNGLQAAAQQREVMTFANPLITLPTARYTLGGRQITVLGDGWPVNFDGDVEDIEPESIQLTRALMFAGALQAASLKIHYAKHRGIIAFDPTVDAQLLKEFKTLNNARSRRMSHESIMDPDRWQDLIRDFARQINRITLNKP